MEHAAASTPTPRTRATAGAARPRPAKTTTPSWGPTSPLGSLGDLDHRLLTRDDEVALSRRVHDGRAADAEITRRRAADTPATGQHAAALRRTVADGLAARETLVLSNRRLVVFVARRYLSAVVSLEDVVQEGMIGLLAAAERYDGAKGFRFSTYATWWIRQAITRSFGQSAPGGLRLPTHLALDRDAVERALSRLESAGAARPPTEAIVAESGLPLARVERVLAYRFTVTSLTASTDDDGRDLLEVLATPGTEETFSRAEPGMHPDSLLRYFDGMNPIDAEVLRLRFGFAGEPLSLSEVGAVVGMTKQRVRQREIRAVKYIRKCQLAEEVPTA